jgi:hypothetical protein
MICNVLLIRAFEGPRHERLERIWVEVAKRAPIRLRIFDNRSMRLRHAQCLAQMWSEEVWRTERACLFTEFDFLPYDRFWEGASNADIAATQYCTRSPSDLRLTTHPQLAGAWYIHIKKSTTVLARRHDVLLGLSLETGKFRDPGNALTPDEFLPIDDAYPGHYGVRVRGRGEHLFWSRHYNDPSYLSVAGFSLADIHRRVDRTIDQYEKDLGRITTLPPAPPAPAADCAPDRGDVAP